MNFKNSLLFTTLVLILGACTGDFHIDPDYDKKLVIQSLFKAGDTIKIEIFRNAALSDAIGGEYGYRNYYAMPGATVLLYEGDRLVDTMYTKRYKSVFESKLVAQENKKYSVQVSHEGYPTAYATTVIPAAVPIQSVPYAVSSDSMNMKLQINVGQPMLDINYYLIRMHTVYHQTGKKRREFYNIDPTFGDELTFDFNSLSINSDIEKVFQVDISDELVNKDALSYQCILPLSTGLAYDKVNDIKLNDTIVVELYSIPHDLYKYNQVTKQYQQNQSANAEPINMHTNVENGLGLFVGYSIYKYTFYYK